MSDLLSFQFCRQLQAPRYPPCMLRNRSTQVLQQSMMQRLLHCLALNVAALLASAASTSPREGTVPTSGLGVPQALQRGCATSLSPAICPPTTALKTLCSMHSSLW